MKVSVYNHNFHPLTSLPPPTGLDIPVPVTLVPIPLIGIEWVNKGSKPRADINARENDLIADDPPSGTTVVRL